MEIHMRTKKTKGPETAERHEERSAQKEVLDKRRKDKQKPSKKGTSPSSQKVRTSR